MNSDAVLTEIPTSLKRLVRLVMRGFYNLEHAIVMDMLIRNPCMKEDDIADLLKFEKKQLRAITAQLKNDRFVKTRLRMETGADGKATRQNYYYIDYKLFVNVLKYKLDHMRRKIETEERDTTSRASFKCTSCEKTFTDLEAGELCDFVTGEFRCSYCNAPVEEDESGLPKANSRLMLARFNEQIEPLYTLLREVDDIKLAPELLDPEPTDMSGLKKDVNGQKNKLNNLKNPGGRMAWSGDGTRNLNYHLGSDQGITVNVGNENVESANAIQPKKEQPVWMTHSTVKNEFQIQDFNKKDDSSTLSRTADLNTSSNQNTDDIMEALLMHERKTIGEEMPVIPGHNTQEESSSESEDSMKLQQQLLEHNVEEMESDDDDGALMIQIGYEKVPLSEITEKHVAKMTPSEKETYIRITRDLYASVYD